jgi:large subunit ribosomal protein L32
MEVLFMGLPKRKLSKARTAKRRATWKIERPTVDECPQCGEPRLPHRVCRACGWYKNKKVLDVAE